MNDFGYTRRISNWTLVKKNGILALIFGLIYQAFGIYATASAVSIFYWLALSIFALVFVLVRRSQKRNGVKRPFVDSCIDGVRQRGVLSLNQMILKGVFTGLLLVILISQGFVITAVVGILLSMANNTLHLLASVPEI